MLHEPNERIFLELSSATRPRRWIIKYFLRPFIKVEPVERFISFVIFTRGYSDLELIWTGMKRRLLKGPGGGEW